MKVVFSDAAKADLTEIGDYIARDNPRRALAFVRRLRVTALRLGVMPNAFPLVPGSRHQGIRRRIMGSYLIFYRVDADRIAILRVLHGARDYERLLFPDPD